MSTNACAHGWDVGQYGPCGDCAIEALKAEIARLTSPMVENATSLQFWSDRHAAASAQADQLWIENQVLRRRVAEFEAEGAAGALEEANRRAVGFKDDWASMVRIAWQWKDRAIALGYVEES